MGWRNRTLPAKKALNRKIRDLKLRSSVNWQGTLKEKGVKKGRKRRAGCTSVFRCEYHSIDVLYSYSFNCYRCHTVYILQVLPN